MRTFSFDGILIFIILQITALPQGISGQYELAYFATNDDDYGSQFWLFQESDKYLSFTWLPFSPYPGFEFELELHLTIYSNPFIILSVNTTSATFKAIGDTCQNSRYSITRKTTESWRRTAGSHIIYYNRVPRITNVQMQSGELRNMTWEQESAFCNRNDVTVIFSGQDNQPLEMIIVQGDEKKFTLRNKAENQLIFAISHGNRFSLPKLDVMTTANSMQTYPSLLEWITSQARPLLIICTVGVVLIISISLIIIILYIFKNK
uniref:Uncharacterized protein n=1 Tax=Trichobilharzia regenti TaxID=157069 RepID=A0AA85J7R9_TRIRE|nr:unnamed protein product [Trichobilharzia regenti]